MKIKTDFVSNSSSTSFVLCCTAVGKDELIDQVNNALQVYITERAWDDEFQAPPLLTREKVSQTESGQFIISDKIYLNAKEIPQWIKLFFIDNDSDACKKLDGAGVKLVSLEIKNP